MVIWEGAIILEERWDAVRWVFNEWAPQKLLGTPFMSYWYKSMVMLKNPMIRLHAKFAAALGNQVLYWAYHWLRGKGGYFLKREGKDPERLPPAMRLAESADFILEFLRRLELKSNPQKYFPELLEWAKSNLDEDSVSDVRHPGASCVKSLASGVVASCFCTAAAAATVFYLSLAAAVSCCCYKVVIFVLSDFFFLSVCNLPSVCLSDYPPHLVLLLLARRCSSFVCVVAATHAVPSRIFPFRMPCRCLVLASLANSALSLHAKVRGGVQQRIFWGDCSSMDEMGRETSTSAVEHGAGSM